MDSKKRENLIKKLQDAVEDLIKDRPSAYEKMVGITENLFYTNYTKVILVMNSKDFNEISDILDLKYKSTGFCDSIWSFKNIQTPHGTVDYLIVDNSVDEMHGYTTDTRKNVYAHKI